MQQIYKIECHSGPLSVAIFTPEQSGTYPAIILGSGWKNSLENNYEFAQEVCDALGCAVVTFDYRGIGSSGGQLSEFSRKDHLNDLIAVYDWVATNDHIDAGKIGVNGGSYSGYLAALLVAERPVLSLLLRAPALYEDATFEIANDTEDKDPEGYYEKVIAGGKCRMVQNAMSSYRNSLLVQERADDVVIPSAVITYYLSHNHSVVKKHSILEGAGHKLTGALKHQSTLECIDWFRDTLTGNES